MRAARPIGGCRWLVFGLVFVLGAMALRGEDALPDAGGFPNRPIRIIVYTSPGGLIDYTARKFADVARKYVDQPMVVINKPGAGGIVAFDDVLQTPADGYTMLAVTKSNISKVLSAGRDDLFGRMDWFAKVMEDPQCLIVNRKAAARDWPAIKTNALERQGRQNWLGPDIGGLDHLSALKIWRSAGIEARWIPYESGGQAIASLLGELGVTYVGNPSEARSNPNLQVAVICAPERLASFPDVPVFREFGVEGVDNESMWRGFAFRKGVPEEIKAWYHALFEKVNRDPDWRGEWEPFGITVNYLSQGPFTREVERDRKESEFYLREIGLMREAGTGRSGLLAGVGEGLAANWMKLALVLANVLLALVLWKSPARHHFGELMILGFLVSVAVMFFILTEWLPAPSNIDRIGAAGVPRLWISLLLPLALYQTVVIVRDRAMYREAPGMPLLVWCLLALCGYILLIPWLGYLLASFLFIPGVLWLMGFRKPLWIAAITVGWLFFAWGVFKKLLHVDLPGGFFG
jgi:tripartite-type tricarboxylate transporter receptor subunit TctC